MFLWTILIPAQKNGLESLIPGAVQNINRSSPDAIPQ